ncbi:addiction module antidote protein [Alcaligenes faecalis]|uniref:addiction module antidote protein n=1 Tax=Alcaligenes faecalis TaxID=511 RepID=UPI001CB8BC39|nr:addiction module antidote protein [Alcaligenes faecalis]
MYEIRIHFSPGHHHVETNSRGSVITTLKTAPFDATEYLDSEEAIAEYLSAALEAEDPALLLSALADVIKLRGISKTTKDACVDRESL